MHDLARQLVARFQTTSSTGSCLAQLDAQPGAAQLARQCQGRVVQRFAHRRDDRRRRSSAFSSRLRLQGQHQAVFADGEADARSIRAANDLLSPS